MFHYQVEIFINNNWILQDRYYYVQKKLNDFDLHDIKNKRRNSKYIKLCKNN